MPAAIFIGMLSALYHEGRRGIAGHVDRREYSRALGKDGRVCTIVKTRTDLIATIRRYAEELERLGVPVECIIL